MTGVVTGNLTSSGTAIPYNISGGYTEPGLNYATLQDDYGRTYAGNPLKAQNELFTQCWNNTLVGALPMHAYSSEPGPAVLSLAVSCYLALHNTAPLAARGQT